MKEEIKSEGAGIDRYFAEPLKSIKPFEFDEGVAEVFDDMVSRSVPFYNEIHQIIKDLLKYNFIPGDKIYDLGCSTGTTIKLMSDFLKGKKATFVGVDNSSPMLIKAQEKLKNLSHKVDLKQSNIEEIELEQSGVIVMNYTLQFLDQANRLEVIKKVHSSLRQKGIFILSEKIKAQEESMQDLLTTLYYDFKKRQGYSELEIAQKREALEEVLTPITPEEQLDMLKKAGFEKSTMLFRWYNFACFLGVKN